MQKYKFLAHTADIKFQAFGKTRKEAFENSALALANIICRDKIKEKIRKKIGVKGKDYEDLLLKFLEEFLFLLETEDFILSKITNLSINNLSIKASEGKSGGRNSKKYQLTAEVFGDKAGSYELEAHVKAITYNEMLVKKEKNKFMCQVVVDV